MSGSARAATGTGRARRRSRHPQPLAQGAAVDLAVGVERHRRRRHGPPWGPCSRAAPRARPRRSPRATGRRRPRRRRCHGRRRPRTASRRRSRDDAGQVGQRRLDVAELDAVAQHLDLVVGAAEAHVVAVGAHERRGRPSRRSAPSPRWPPCARAGSTKRSAVFSGARQYPGTACGPHTYSSPVPAPLTSCRPSSRTTAPSPG